MYSGHSNPQIVQTNQPIYVHNLFLHKWDQQSPAYKKKEALWIPKVPYLVTTSIKHSDPGRGHFNRGWQSFWQFSIVASVVNTKSKHHPQWMKEECQCQTARAWYSGSAPDWYKYPKSHNSIGAQSSQGCAHKRKAPKLALFLQAWSLTHTTFVSKPTIFVLILGNG